MAMRDFSEIEKLINAYRNYWFDRHGAYPVVNVGYYDAITIWLADNGCEINLFRIPEDQPKWESESRKVEFYLRWM